MREFFGAILLLGATVLFQVRRPFRRASFDGDTIFIAPSIDGC
jgi:hypothetical protein